MWRCALLLASALLCAALAGCISTTSTLTVRGDTSFTLEVDGSCERAIREHPDLHVVHCESDRHVTGFGYAALVLTAVLVIVVSRPSGSA
jgi:hypothetical protein